MPRKAKPKPLLGQGYEPHPWNDRLRLWVIIDRETGERKAVYGKTPEECHRKADALLRKLEQGVDVRHPSTTVKQYVDYWLGEVMPRRVTASTLQAYRYDLGHVLRHLGTTKLERLTRLEVERAILSLSSEVSDRAAAQGLGRLFQALEHAVMRGRIANNPAKIEKPVSYNPKGSTVWSGEEVVRFLQGIEERSSYHPLFYTALNTGMRVGEMYALHRTDLHLEEQKIRVHRTTANDGRGRHVIQNHPKTHYSVRTLDISPDHATLLRSWLGDLDAWNPNRELVFPSRAGSLLGYSNVRRELTRYAKDLGVPVIRPHDMRHTFASLTIATMCQRGEFDILHFSRNVMGHSSAAFTMQRYAHIIQRYGSNRRAYSLNELTGLEENKGRDERIYN